MYETPTYIYWNWYKNLSIEQFEEDWKVWDNFIFACLFPLLATARTKKTKTLIGSLFYGFAIPTNS